MSPTPSLAVRLDPAEKAMLKELAARLRRSQTETIRVLVREALAILKEQDAKLEGKGGKTPIAIKRK